MFQQNNSINHSASTTPLSSEYCRRFQDEEHRTVKVVVTLVSILLYASICPLVILMNVLVIAAVKTRRRLQSMSNILLACLAGTDLLVGTVTLPTIIVAEIFAIADGSTTTYCNIIRKIVAPLRDVSVLASLFHLPVISVDRLIALKYPLRYEEIVTKFRITIATIIAWFIATTYTIFNNLFASSLFSFVLQFMAVLNLSIVVYCHISLCFISRRHEKQIRSEQMPGEAASKFREEKKAWKTTAIIIGCVFFCLLPGCFDTLGVMINLDRKWFHILRPLVVFFLMLNSLCNPIIYCFRSNAMRKAMIAILTRQPGSNLE